MEARNMEISASLVGRLGDIDALCSLATFAGNHPAYAYPAIAGKPFVFLAKDMGHPLMPARQCVTNDADIPSRPFFVIITGATWQGKVLICVRSE